MTPIRKKKDGLGNGEWGMGKKGEIYAARFLFISILS